MTTIEKKPAHPIPPDWRLTVYSWTSGLICCLLFVSIGRTAPMFRDVYHGFNVPPNWAMKLVDATHLWWTLPVGLLVAGFLVLKDRSALRPRAVLIDSVVLLITFSFALVWAWAAFLPVFHASSEIINPGRY